MLISRLSLHVFHSWLSHVWPVPRVIIPCVTIPCVTIPCMTIPRMAQDELHEMCIFHTTRKRGSCSHVTGLLKYLLCCHACTHV